MIAHFFCTIGHWAHHCISVVHNVCAPLSTDDTPRAKECTLQPECSLSTLTIRTPAAQHLPTGPLQSAIPVHVCITESLWADDCEILHAGFNVAGAGKALRANTTCSRHLTGIPMVSITRSMGLFLYPAPPPCISYTNVRNYYGPYAYCSLHKGVACAQHIQLPTHTCTRAWYECTLTSTHSSKSMQTQESLGNMKISGSHPCCHKQ